MLFRLSWAGGLAWALNEAWNYSEGPLRVQQASGRDVAIDDHVPRGGSRRRHQGQPRQMQGLLIGGFSGFLGCPTSHTPHVICQLGSVARRTLELPTATASLQLTQTQDANGHAFQGGRFQRPRKGKEIAPSALEASACSPDFPIASPPNPAAMDSSLDKTTLATISLLETRLHRIEHILYGSSEAPQEHHGKSAAESLVDLERRFHQLIGTYRVYTEILKICTYISAFVLCYWGEADSSQTTPTPPSSTRPPPTPPLQSSSPPKPSARPSCPSHPRSRPSHPPSPRSHPTHRSQIQNSAPS